MKYVVKTQQGHEITLGEDFNPDTYEAVLQKQEIEAVAFGEVSMLKRNIRFIAPVYEEEETPEGKALLIYPSSGGEPMIAHSTEYSSGDLANAVNHREPFLRVGDTFINLSEFSLVTPEQ